MFDLLQIMSYYAYLKNALMHHRKHAAAFTMRWAGHVTRMGKERRDVYGLGGETGGKEATGET